MNDLCTYGIEDKNKLVRVIKVEEESVIYFQKLCMKTKIEIQTLYL